MPLMSYNPDAIVDSFNRYFCVIQANTPELRDLVFRVRHQVYCEEFNYEPLRAEHIERDAYDEHSRYCLLMHKATAKAIGCFRLILPNPNNLDAPLPFEQFCPRPRTREGSEPVTMPYGAIGEIPSSDDAAVLPSIKGFNMASIPRDSFCEASRLAVVAEFRRRKDDEKSTISLTGCDSSEGHRQALPYIPINLFLAGFALFMRTDLRYVFALMEPRLVRSLARFGLQFLQVGSIVNFHGFRGPFVFTRQNAFDNLKPSLMPLFSTIDQQLFGDSASPVAFGGAAPATPAEDRAPTRN